MKKRIRNPILNDVSEADLLAELERRKQREKAPEPLRYIDWKKVIALAHDIVEEIRKNHVRNDDNLHYMYEEVMKAVYGDDYFDWENRLNG